MRTTNKELHVSVAPMMDWTDRHCRFFHRLISPHVRLYTEMITAGAILHGDRDRFLRFDEAEHPVAIQLGGSDPGQLAECAGIAEAYGYDEINLNCGCPSDRVQNGMFGACLMEKPAVVAACVEAMASRVRVPVTVKCRIGIDEKDSFEFLDDFVRMIREAGCRIFIIHARKAWLSGLSPKENREIPALNYDRALEIKDKHPDLNIILNGGLADVQAIRDNLNRLDGVMIGREAYHNPWFLAEIEAAIFGTDRFMPREDIARRMMEYAARQNALYGTPVKSVTRHILGLYQHQPGAKAWRRALSTLPYEDGAGPKVIQAALLAQSQAALVRDDRITA